MTDYVDGFGSCSGEGILVNHSPGSAAASPRSVCGTLHTRKCFDLGKVRLAEIGRAMGEFVEMEGAILRR